MNAFSKISDRAKHKLQLYVASMVLFDSGKSHPQIVEQLRQYEPDENLLVEMVDYAMKEKWDKLFQKARQLFSQNKTYDQVLLEISKDELDPEIAKWLCESWYEAKSFYAECIIESRGNIREGSTWAIISIVVTPFLFLINLSIVSKILWGLVCIGAIIQWIVGIKQRRLSRQIAKIFEDNESNQ